MRVACISYFYDRDLTSPDALLERYDTLTGWAEGLASAGAQVAVVQRFAYDAEVERSGIHYTFVRDATYRAGSLTDVARRINRAVASLRPDLVHGHGLTFARQARGLKCLLPRARLLLQDHGERPPTRWISRVTLRAALRQADAVSFVAREQAIPWIEAGLLPAETPVFALMEGSSRFRSQPREEARTVTGLRGDPLCLWVGRLDANKDPLTVLRGFARAQCDLPNAHLALVYSEGALLSEVRAWLAANPVATRVTLLGCLPHAALEAVYNSADGFLLGSHHEGSGYAVLESLSCGLTPLVTDIPSFRVLTDNGKIGRLWAVGDEKALAQTLLAWQAQRTPETPAKVRRYFEEHWSFEAIGRQALAAYRQLLRGKEYEDRSGDAGRL